MTERDVEKDIIARLASQRDAELTKAIIRLLEMRFERYKNSLVTNDDGALRGRAQECRELLRHIAGTPNGAL